MVCNMNRRSFLKSALALVLPLAPAIVRADSLMRILPQRVDVVLPGLDLGSGDFTVEFWLRPDFASALSHHVHVHSCGAEFHYVNGAPSPLNRVGSDDARIDLSSIMLDLNKRRAAPTVYTG